LGFQFDAIDTEISALVPDGTNTINRTKGSGSDAFLSIDQNIGTNHNIGFTDKPLVRTSKGILYFGVRNLGVADFEMHKSIDEGNTFTAQDTGNEPTCDKSTVCLALRSDDDIECVWWDENVGLRHCVFDTVTDTFGTVTTIRAQQGTLVVGDRNTSSTLDSNGKLHVLFSDHETEDSILYTNNVSGSWKTPVIIREETSADYSHNHSITVDADDIPQGAYVWHDGSIDKFNAIRGNQNDATSFSNFQNASNTDPDPPTMVVTEDGTTIVTFIDGNADAIIYRHIKNKAWSSWETKQIISNAFTYLDAQLTIDGAGDIYLFTVDDENNQTRYWKSTNNGRTWGAIQSDNMGGITENTVRTRWSFHNYHFRNKLDYVVYDTVADDVYFNTVLVSPSLVLRDWGQHEQQKGNNLGAKAIVRTSDGQLFKVVHDTTSDHIEVHRSLDEHGSWTEQDSGNHPVGNSNAVAMAIDSNDILHIVWWEPGTGLRYNTMNGTIGPTWGTPVTAVSDTSTPLTDYVAITIDSNDIPHAVYSDNSVSTFVARYTNRIGGTWKAPNAVHSAGLPSGIAGFDLTVDADDIPVYVGVYITSGTQLVATRHANQNDATSWSNGFNSTVSVDMFAPGICVDKKGDIYVSWTSAGDIKVRKHLYDDAVGTWQSIVNVFTGTVENTSMTLDSQDNPVIFVNLSDNSRAYRSTDGGTTWAQAFSQTAPFANDDGMTVRWSYNNHHFPRLMDFMVAGTASNYIESNTLFETGPDDLFVVGRNGSLVEVRCSSTNGITWREVDDGNEPTGASSLVSSQIDGNDDIHIVYYDLGVGYIYALFDMGTQLHGTQETAKPNTATRGQENLALAIDYNNVPHIVYAQQYALIDPDIEYRNKVGGSWGSDVFVEGDNFPTSFTSIVITQDNYPMIICQTSGQYVHRYFSASNDPVGFTQSVVSTTATISTARPDIAIDSSNAYHLVYVRNGDIKYRSGSEKNIKTGTFSSATLSIDHNDNIFIFSTESGVTYCWFSTDGGASFTETSHNAPTITDANARVRNSTFFNYNPSKIDYTIYNGVTAQYNSGFTTLFDTLTKVITIDANLQETQTKNVSMDALLVETKTKSITTDAILQETKTKQVSVDAQLSQAGKDVTFDALIQQKAIQKTVTMDSIIGVPCATLRLRTVTPDRSGDTFRLRDCDQKEQGGSVTKQITFDALLVETKQKAVSVDARLVNRLTKAISLDGLLSKIFSKSVSFDALLKLVSTKAVSVDALLQATKTKNISVDALLSKIFSKSVSLDAILQATQSKIVSLDARLINKISKSISIDALLKEAFTKVISLDARLVDRFTKDVSLDAILQQTRTKIISLDARLVNVRSKLITLDAMLQEARTKNVSLDSILVNRLTKSISIDSLLQDIRSKVVSLDAVLQQTRTKLVSIDARIGSSVVKLVSMDAVLQKLQSKNISIDARLINRLTKSVSLDALLSKTLTKSVSLDAILQKLQSKSVSIDALLQATKTKAISIDSMLKQALTKSVSVDARLINKITKSVSLDAFLQQLANTKSISIDALLKLVSTKNISLDAVLRATTTKAVSINAILQQTRSKVISLDARLINVRSKVISLDAYLQDTFSKNVSIDARLINRLTKSISVDAFLQNSFSKIVSLDARLINRLTKGVTLDALLQQIKSKSVSIDSILVNRLTKAISLDALLQAVKTKSVSLDARLVNRFTKNISLDAFLQELRSKAVSIDALLQEQFTKNISIDAMLQQVRTKQASIDAVLQQTRTKVTSIDARLVNRITKFASIDALLQATKTKAVSMDARVGIAKVKEITVDAILQATKTKGITLDAVLATIQNKSVSIDAILQKKINKSVSIDAFLQAVKSKVISLDALLQDIKSKNISIDTILQASFTKGVTIDALLQGLKSKVITIDALLSEIRTKGVSVDAVLASVVNKIISMDSILVNRLTKSTSFDALLQSQNVQKQISLDAVLEFFEPLSELHEIDLISQSIDDNELVSQSTDSTSLVSQETNEVEIGENDLTISLISESLDEVDVEEDK